MYSYTIRGIPIHGLPEEADDHALLLRTGNDGVPGMGQGDTLSQGSGHEGLPFQDRLEQVLLLNGWGQGYGPDHMG
jgi:hypothetical protein